MEKAAGMASLGWVVLLCYGTAIVTARPLQDGETELDLRMPDVQPQIADTYLCFPYKLSNKNIFITGFVPHANMTTAHHMLIYGCDEPGNREQVWNCGEMQSKTDAYEVGPVCKSGSNIIYAWGMGAPELNLPEDTAFRVGGDSDVHWLVLQVHYKDVHAFIPPVSGSDHSGVTLHKTTQPKPRLAGVYLLATGGEIPAHSTTYMETACSYDERAVMHPFAFRVHAHVHGEVVSGYRVRGGDWTEIGRMDPKKEQMFYNVTNPGLEVRPGDILAARCTMTNDEDRTVPIGSTQHDEMCNFYVMYYMENGEEMRTKFCYTDGPPHWSWASMKQIQVEHAPSNASLVPGQDKVIQATRKSEKIIQGNTEDVAEEVRNEFIELLEMLKQEYEEEEREETLRKSDLLEDYGLNQYYRPQTYEWWPQEAEERQEGQQNYFPDDLEKQLPDVA